ncbi:hypothetical protein QLS91_04110 [Flavobacterium sp. LB2P84]|uniref:hypothetical protein n=1 Tax=Flavobacterium yafengii TaxID=3041253 RepID=UPI0024A91FBE|nr:hypothetical protein [Flavobacterium yafengii]MDI6032250.1 hypothetical protein [Flavobacterium yafengii]
MGKLFKEAKDWENESFIRKNDNKWLYYSEGYKIAAELIEQELITKLESRDFLIYPLIYLHRHYLELKLKEIIVEGNCIIGAKDFLPKGGHNLINLWKESLEILHLVWGDDFKIPAVTIENKIKELHNADVKSDGFRYPIDKDGEENLKSVQKINYRNFRDEFLEIKYFIEGVTDGLYATKDFI